MSRVRASADKSAFTPEPLLAPTLSIATPEYSKYLANYEMYLDALESARQKVRAVSAAKRDPSVRVTADFGITARYTWLDSSGKVLSHSNNKNEAPKNYGSRKINRFSYPVVSFAKSDKSPPKEKPVAAEPTEAQIAGKVQRRKAALKKKKLARAEASLKAKVTEAKQRTQLVAAEVKLLALKNKSLKLSGASKPPKSFADVVKDGEKIPTEPVASSSTPAVVAPVRLTRREAIYGADAIKVRKPKVAKLYGEDGKKSKIRARPDDVRVADLITPAYTQYVVESAPTPLDKLNRSGKSAPVDPDEDELPNQWGHPE